MSKSDLNKLIDEYARVRGELNAILQSGTIITLSADVAPKQVGEKVRFLRASMGLTQDDVAQKSGTNPKFVGRVERGATNPTLETVTKLAEAVDADVLFGLLPNTPDDGP